MSSGSQTDPGPSLPLLGPAGAQCLETRGGRDFDAQMSFGDSRHTAVQSFANSKDGYPHVETWFGNGDLFPALRLSCRTRTVGLRYAADAYTDRFQNFYINTT